MLGIHDLWLFIVAGLLLNVTPGPDTAYIVGRSVQQGWRGGAAAALGIGAGCLVHVFGTAAGLAAVLAASSMAFTLVKLAGATYLLFIGLRMAFARHPRAPAAEAASPAGLSRVFWQGALTNALNPKVALFFLAFLPQFVDADAPHQAWAFVVLGAIFVTNGTLWCLGIAAASAHAAQRLRAAGRLKLWVDRVLGGLFVALGLRMILTAQR